MNKATLSIFAAFCALFFFSLQGAAPLTHIYLADLWCQERGYDEVERELLLKGSVFPDIQKMLGLPYSATHKTAVTFSDIQSACNPFEEGALLHSYVDTHRAVILSDREIIERVKEDSFGFASRLLKIVEDEIVYERCDGGEYQEIFWGTPFQEELDKGIHREEIAKWNKRIAIYLGQKPSQLCAYLAEQNQTIHGISPSVLQAWSEAIPRLAKDPVIIAYFEDMLKNFHEDFSEGKPLLTLQ